MPTLSPDSAAARDLASGRYHVRPMTPDETETVAVAWMRAAGWNPGVHDGTTFRAHDPEGFLVGVLDGEPIACVSAIRYDDTFGFFGCYLVREDLRGRGYGLALHEAGRRRLAGCVQGGDAVIENVAKYERIGRVAAWRNARFAGTVPHRPVDATTIDARTVPLDSIAVLDRTCFPAPRPEFLAAWIHQPAGIARAVVDDDGGCLGYAVARPCHVGWKIGSLFATTPTVAARLFSDVLGRLPAGDTFVLDVPEPNAAARELVDAHGMTEVFATMRMFTGPVPPIRLDRVYGITTFELG